MTKALVLSGGGSVGIAWQTGLAAGLASKGVVLADADFIVGTSAGSAVGATLALGLDLQERVQRYENASKEALERGTTATPQRQAPAIDPGRMQKLMEVMAKAQSGELPEEEGRAAIGRFALEAETPPEETFIGGFRYLAGQGWPKRYACTAVDAETGAFQVWDESSGADLERAVASSCAVPGLFPPITINGRRYIDGGMRSGTNADLAKGHDTVLIVSLMSSARAAAAPADARMERYRARMDAELATITDAGGKVQIVGPDEQAASVMGLNLMDGSIAPAAAKAGKEQGERIAGELRGFWG